MSLKTPLLLAVGEYLHVYNRGANRDVIFHTDHGYRMFIELMAKETKPEEISVHAFCLMPNHFHLIVRQEVEYAVSKFMKRVCEPYSKAVNRWLLRRGHLFEGRYRAKRIRDISHLPRVSRYIHMNPVAGGIVDSPVAWRYSSCGEFCGVRKSEFLTLDAVFSQVGGHNEYARYLRENSDGYGEDIVECLIDWGLPS